MKNLKALIMLLCMLCMFSLAACSGSSNTTSVGSGTSTISGTVFSGGAFLPGATVTLSGTSTGTTTTDANGNYSFTGATNGNYVLTPSKTGYSFTSVSTLVTINSADVNSQNFIATATPATTYSISGTITLNSVGQPGVIVALTGAATGAAITDASGNYSFAGLQNGSYTVTPAIGGYSFSPGNASVTVNNANVTGKNFTASGVVSVPMSASAYNAVVNTAITVTATFPSSENGKTATFSSTGGGSLTSSTVTIAGGTATTFFSSTTPGTFNINVVESLYAGGISVTITATPASTYSISGTITLNSVGQSGVMVALTGVATGAAITDASGNYSFAGLLNGSYTVTPAIGGYSFTPGNASVTVNNASVTGKDFTATGVVSVPMSASAYNAVVNTAITVTAKFPSSENGKTATFSSTGGGSLTSTSVTIAGDGTATTSFSSTTPGTFNINVVEGLYAGGISVTITAAPTPTYSISGTITLNSVGQPGVMVALTGVATGAAITDASGNYSFAGLQNGGYTVTPAIGGYSFTPGDASVTVNNANVTGINFTENPSITFSCTTGNLSPLGRWCDNENGTVRDMATGLIWLQDASWGGTYTWTAMFDGVSTVQNGTPASLSDGSAAGAWRLPTIGEFQALITGTEPIRSSDMYKFINIKGQGYVYWSSSSYNTDDAWYVTMAYGSVFSGVKYYNGYVWPVRSGQ